MPKSADETHAWIARHMSDYAACADSLSGLPLLADLQVMTSKKAGFI